MIRVIRPEAPPYFQSPQLKRHIDELRALKQNDGQQRLHFRPEALKPVRPFLMAVFQSKCAYCESLLGAASLGEIDNFRPKAGTRGLGKAFAPDHYWWLAYEWSNLYLACQICNSKYKCNWFPLEDDKLRAAVGATGDELKNERPLLVDPCSDDPEEHLEFAINGVVNFRTPRGKATIDILGLNRKELVYARKQAVLTLLSRLSTYAKKSDKVKNGLHVYVDRLFSDAPPQPYAAMERSAFRQWHAEHKAMWQASDPGVIAKEAIPAKNAITGKSKPTRRVQSNIQKVENQLADSLRRFSIKSVEITNFRSIEHLKLSIPPSSTDDESRESWLLMLGDNGVGKSSILQAVALALVGATELKRLKPSPKDVLRRGTSSGSVVIESYEHNDPVRLDFNAKEIKGSLPEAPTFILGYGSTRLLPKGSLQPSGKCAPRTNVANLFDYSVALTDVNRWLHSLDADAFEQRIAPALFDLLDLQPGERVVLRRGKLVIEENDGICELEKASDGYKSIIAMACDVMKALWVDGAGYHTVQGIVLIDELGNHLHPKWRMKIAGSLRRAFPKLQFLVTTHEPLCLRGLAYGEVNVLLEKPGEGIIMLAGEDLPDHNLLSIDQLLTSDLFGLLETLDPATQEAYNRYYALLGKKPAKRTKEDRQQIEEYRAKLTAREVIGETPRNQMLLQVMDEVWAKNIKENGFKTVSELKQETVSEVKSMIADTNKDWL